VSRASVVSGGLLLLLGLLSIAEALRVRDDWLGAKLMPLIVGGVLVLLGAAHLVGPAEAKPAWPDAASARRVVVMFMALALYVALMPVLGFLLATFLLALALVRMLATYSWTRTLLTTAGIAVGSHVVFQRWLGMPLPALWE
jgi:putative tricarboxylic transport membrane protein